MPTLSMPPTPSDRTKESDSFRPFGSEGRGPPFVVAANIPHSQRPFINVRSVATKGGPSQSTKIIEDYFQARVACSQTANQWVTNISKIVTACPHLGCHPKQRQFPTSVTQHPNAPKGRQPRGEEKVPPNFKKNHLRL